MKVLSGGNRLLVFPEGTRVDGQGLDRPHPLPLQLRGDVAVVDHTAQHPGPLRRLRQLPGHFHRPAGVEGLTIVSQTTLRRKVWEDSLKILKKQCTNLKIFDTICDATHTRQSEAAQLASQVDAMVVVGDPKSANTAHLTEICRQGCGRGFPIESGGASPRDHPTAGLQECSRLACNPDPRGLPWG